MDMKQKDTKISQTAIPEESTQFCDMIH